MNIIYNYWVGKLAGRRHTFRSITNSYFAEHQPWSGVWKNRTVLVVSPFVNLIRDQYDNHVNHGKLLFDDPEVLPRFKVRIEWSDYGDEQ